MWKLLLSYLFMCATVEGILVPLDSFSQDTFVKLFRQVLLEKVAVEWNVTVEQSNVLKTKNTECNTKMDAKVNACKSEAQSTCGQSPSFTDYLNLINPYTYMKGPLDDIGNSIASVGNLVADGGKQFVSFMNGLVSSTGKVFTDAFSGLKDGLNKLGGVFGSTGNTVLGGLGSVGSSIKDGLSSVGSGIKDGFTTVTDTLGSVGQTIGSALGSIFRGKREITAEARRCMERCASCQPLLLDKEQMVRSICGDEAVELNKTVSKRVHHISAIYNATIDALHPIVSKIEYDPTSMNNMKFTTVFLTAYVKGSNVRYQSSVAYAIMDLPGTVRDMALEYWNKMA
ncbi:hypothetical protein CHS0354_039050 [Potamilus streckersoni]|uniref:Uncharacterized protein n=1 Tax=Potamilus streckersoni TaxID=2493646 RepID=A0AAE0RRV0_9BIVA|nr:hypothetical protein CHS0354_039050 [Potamilus streckersoni]